MIFCCNSPAKVVFRYILSGGENYHRIEFAICTHCGKFKFTDYRMSADGSETVRKYTFNEKEFYNRLNAWKTRINNTKQGTRLNQSFYYGDCARKRTKNGIIDIQLRKNFNNVTEIIGESKLKRVCV